MEHRRTRTLRISNFSLQIEGPAGWVDWMSGRWQAWIDSQPGDSWKLSLTVGSTVPNSAPLYQARPSFADGICRVAAPGFSGRIEPERGVAHLSAHPRADLSDLSIFVRTCLALQVFEQGGLLFHAAGVVREGKGYALFGHSGCGKTTAASLSRGDLVLNDDLILIKPGEAEWQIWGTPFGGDWLPQARPVPLRGLLRLVPGQEDRLEALGPGVILSEVVANSPVINAYPARLPALLARWEDVLSNVPAQALHFRKSPAFWEVIDAEVG